MSDAPARADFLERWMGEAGGAARFDDWMRQALFHPEFGYYTTAIRGVGGPRADFTTWPARDERLALAVAGWIRAHRWRGRGQPVIEIGPGSGVLAAAIFKSFPFWQKPALALVETSPRLRALQQNTLRGRAAWHEHPGSALEAARGEALLYANELADAFPCRVFRRGDGGWKELHITLRDGGVCPLWLAAGSLPDSEVFAHDWPPGQIVEVHEAFREWLEGWRGAWRRGRLLLVDYGAPDARTIYHRRPGGTLRGYARHQRLDFPELLGGFGRRDITADVNFGDLGRWAGGLGLRPSVPRPLHDFFQVPNCEELAAFYVMEIEALPAAEAGPAAARGKTDSCRPKA